jgi:hypothetical protein
MLDFVVDVREHRGQVLGELMLQDLNMPRILEDGLAERVLVLKDLKQEMSASLHVEITTHLFRRDIKRHDVVWELVELLQEFRARNQH